MREREKKYEVYGWNGNKVKQKMDDLSECMLCTRMELLTLRGELR